MFAITPAATMRKTVPRAQQNATRTTMPLEWWDARFGVSDEYVRGGMGMSLTFVGVGVLVLREQLGHAAGLAIILG